MPKLLSNPYTKNANTIATVLQQQPTYLKPTQSGSKDLSLTSNGDLFLDSSNVKLSNDAALWLGEQATLSGSKDGSVKLTVNGKEIFSVDSGALNVDNISIKGTGVVAGKTTWSPVFSGGETVANISDVTAYVMDGIITLSLTVTPNVQWQDCVITSSLPNPDLDVSNCIIRDDTNASVFNQSVNVKGSTVDITFLSQGVDMPHKIDVTFVPK